MTAALGWGLIGTGWAAGMFTDAVVARTGRAPVAVAARDPRRAARFAADHGIRTAHRDVDALLSDPDVDIVYIATPHHTHLPLALAVLAAGRPVLVEKPLAMTAVEGARIAEAARAAGVLAMEAMWTSYLPRTAELVRMVDSGRIGRVREVRADFGAVFDDAPEHRTQDPAQGGGVLLDLGVYHLAWARHLLGPLEIVSVRGTLSATGVEDAVTLELSGRGGTRATLRMSMREGRAGEGVIIGDAGRVELDAPFFLPGGFAVIGDGATRRWEDPSGMTGSAGMALQAEAAEHYVASGVLDSPVRPLADAMADLAIIDRARSAIGAAAFTR